MPPNGLVVYCGTIVTEEGKEKKVNIDFEPFKPINTSLYLCDNKFHTEVRGADLISVSRLLRHESGSLSVVFLSVNTEHLPPVVLIIAPFVTPSHRRHWRPCSLMTASSVLSWSTVAGHCLAHCRATPGKCYTSSPSTYPRSTVRTDDSELFFLFSPSLLARPRTTVKPSLNIVLSLSQAEEVSPLCVSLVWEWKRDTTTWGRWLRQLSSSLCPTTKSTWREWSWPALPTSRPSSASRTCSTR